MRNSVKIYRIVVSVVNRFGIGRFAVARVINAFVFRLLKTDFAEVQGHKMFLDSKDTLNLSIDGIYEKSETEYFRNSIKKGDVILDIGANIGYYTLIFAKLVGEDGKVFAFEPDPTNFSILQKNVEINGYQNVVLVNKAVSDENGELRLFLCEDNRGDHRIYNCEDGRVFVDIEGVRLDDYFRGQNVKIDFIKMDIQGAEYRAAKGMAGLLDKNQDVKIVSEFCPGGLKQSGADPADYLNFLVRHGFVLSEIGEAENKIVRINDPASLLEKYAVERGDYANLLCERGWHRE